MDQSIFLADNLDPHGDAFYNALMEAHENLSDAQSHELNARLVLMMANQIGDIATLKSIISKAGEFQT